MNQATTATTGASPLHEVQDLLRQAARLWVGLQGPDAWSDYPEFLKAANEELKGALDAANYAP